MKPSEILSTTVCKAIGAIIKKLNRNMDIEKHKIANEKVIAVIYIGVIIILNVIRILTMRGTSTPIIIIPA